MRSTAPENLDDDATTDQLDCTWKDQVDSTSVKSTYSTRLAGLVIMTSQATAYTQTERQKNP